MESYLGVNKEGQITSHVGADAVRRFHAITVKHAIKMIGETNGKIIPTRGYNMKRGLLDAGKITGKVYKRTEWQKAIADLDVWINNMTAALPVIEY
jgi:hypothetical protein